MILNAWEIVVALHTQSEVARGLGSIWNLAATVVHITPATLFIRALVRAISHTASPIYVESNAVWP